ncbi:hypothetical protein EGK75_13800 [Neisseria weixii]|uniref:Uncharacterized protein n=1 Tax=Neisseria weixii TaxID=1853276 RepID=A0A3N4MZE5_9NEIS|nr:hypothetical protein [Neisseria weixii]RPD83144.1 hypothetical protein EGK75_13800 [Neisseria weixii]RPD89372.1 hypothetical protein EGK74_03895 [Neisseria weixii]
MKYAIRTLAAAATVITFISCTPATASKTPEDIPPATGLSDADKLMFEIDTERMKTDENIRKMREQVDKMQLPRGDAEVKNVLR